MAINERVKLIMEHNELTSGEFADKTGIQQSTLSHFINGRNKASLDVVTKIHQAFSDVSLNWLLYGQGEMLQDYREGNGVSSYGPTGSPYSEKNIDKAYPSTSGGSTIEGFGAIAPILAQSHRESVQHREPAKPPRRITEIRVFYDDNTYETFRNENK